MLCAWQICLAFRMESEGGTCMHRCPAEGAGFSPSCSLQCSRLLLEAVGHLQLKDWRQLCSDAAGAGRIPLEIQEGWEAGVGVGGEAVCQPQRSDTGYSSVHCITFCFSRSSSFLKRDVWQAASPGCSMCTGCFPRSAASPLGAICLHPAGPPAQPCTQGPSGCAC